MRDIRPQKKYFSPRNTQNTRKKKVFAERLRGSTIKNKNFIRDILLNQKNIRFSEFEKISQNKYIHLF